MSLNIWRAVALKLGRLDYDTIQLGIIAYCRICEREKVIGASFPSTEDDAGGDYAVYFCLLCLEKAVQAMRLIHDDALVHGEE